VLNSKHRSKPIAVEWFRKAARQGNANAMFNLGAAYYNGDGVDISDTLSYAWFISAKQAGNQRAQEASQMSAKRWQDVEKRLPDMHLDPTKVDAALLTINSH
jgi:TPR repeat protein